MSEEIVVNILPDGSIRAEAKGFKGKSCEESMKFLEKLGLVTEKKKKAEYHQKAATVKKLRMGKKKR